MQQPEVDNIQEEFKKENVAYAYKMLNLPLSPTDRAAYNQFLTTFQVSLISFITYWLAK